MVGGIVVSTEVLGLRAVRLQGAKLRPRRWRSRCLREEGNAMRRTPETQEAGNIRWSRRRLSGFWHPVNLLFKELQIHHEVGVVFHQRIALVTSPTFSTRREPLPRSTWARAVGMSRNSPDVPACVDAGMEYHVQFVLTTVSWTENSHLTGSKIVRKQSSIPRLAERSRQRLPFQFEDSITP